MTLRAIARHTIAEAVRMKVALAFILLITLLVVGLPFAVRGDGTVTGSVQSYLARGLGGVSLLLSVLTVFMSRSVSDELAQRQILVLMTKPVGRWQYLLGKWLGIMTLNCVLLLVACGGIYGMVLVIAARSSDVPGDHQRLRDEVLTARHTSPVVLPEQEIISYAQRQFDDEKAGGKYDGIADFNPDKRLKELYAFFEDRWRTVAPFEARQFDFKRVFCDRTRRLEATLIGSGPTRGTARYEEQRADSTVTRRLEIEVSGARARDALTVLIDGRRAGLITVDPDGAGRLLLANADGRSWPEELPDINEGREVELAPDFGGVFQSANNLRLRYKATAIRYAPDEVLRSLWQFGDPQSGLPVYQRPRADVVDHLHDIPVPTDAVDDTHDWSLTAAFLNQNPLGPTYPSTAQFPKDAPMEVLFGVGTFLGNLSRWFALTLCRLMFLAAVALLWVSLFSYPVAFLATMSVFVLCSMRGFIGESFEFLNVNDAGWLLSKMVWLITQALRGLFFMLPDLSRYNATALLVDGRNVTLTWVLTGVGMLGLVQTSIVMLLACLLFWRREVAEVSV